MHAVAKALAIGALLACLAGCSSVAPGKPNAAGAKATAAKASEKVVAIPDGVIATAALAKPDGSPAGKLILTKSGANLDFVVSGITWTTSNNVSIAFADQAVSATECADDNVYQAAFAPGVSPSHGKLTGDLILSSASDPSFFKNVLLVEEHDATASGCIESILGLGSLEWSVPDTHPDLVVIDGGSAPGALGAVTIKNGKPWSYRTHHGDTWVGIAARFGITQSDLNYLNPIRLGNSAPDVAYTDQILNLSKSNRGNSESRRASD